MFTYDPNKGAILFIYDPAKCAVFCKVKEQHGGCSNMAGGFPLKVHGVDIRFSESLYQALRYPKNPEVQQAIIAEKSPMSAKMKAKSYLHLTRPDWDDVRVHIMWWCVRLKLAQNWESFSKVLLDTGAVPIVEKSHKDTFWGAKLQADGTLVGENTLGRILGLVREEVVCYGRTPFRGHIRPLLISDFIFLGAPIPEIEVLT